MNQDTLEQDLSEVFRVIFGREVTRDLSRATEPSWDSLCHMQIIFSVEERFGVRFTEDEIANFDSFGRILERLEQHDAP